MEAVPRGGCRCLSELSGCEGHHGTSVIFPSPQARFQQQGGPSGPQRSFLPRAAPAPPSSLAAHLHCTCLPPWSRHCRGHVLAGGVLESGQNVKSLTPQ